MSYRIFLQLKLDTVGDPFKKMKKYLHDKVYATQIEAEKTCEELNASTGEVHGYEEESTPRSDKKRTRRGKRG